MSERGFGITGPRNLNGRDLSASLGAMREDVTLRSTVRTKGTGGFATTTPTSVITTKAEVAFVGGATEFAAGDTRGQAVIEARIRWRSDVQTYWELLWKGDTYQVLDTPQNYDGRRRFLWLRCGRVGTAQAVAN